MLLRISVLIRVVSMLNTNSKVLIQPPQQNSSLLMKDKTSRQEFCNQYICPCCCKAANKRDKCGSKSRGMRTPNLAKAKVCPMQFYFNT